MNNVSPNAGVLWTGGKDSTLALYEAKLAGYNIIGLITFAPPRPKFLAHPIGFMKYQANALNLPHYTLKITEPFKESYEKAILSLKEGHKISTLVTGDIAEVDGQPNWIRVCSKYSGVDVLTPLWGIDRRELIEKLLSLKFKAIFSCVKEPWFTMKWLGKELSKESLEELLTLSKKTGLDVCGEQGEYHTLVLDGPLFQKAIHIGEYAKRKRDSLMYIEIQEVTLLEK